MDNYRTIGEALKARPDPNDRSVGIDWGWLAINVALWAATVGYIAIAIVLTRAWG